VDLEVAAGLILRCVPEFLIVIAQRVGIANAPVLLESVVDEPRRRIPLHLTTGVAELKVAQLAKLTRFFADLRWFYPPPTALFSLKAKALS
jgi:hypothetical protein